MGNPNCCFMIIAVTFFFSSQSPRGTVIYIYFTAFDIKWYVSNIRIFRWEFLRESDGSGILQEFLIVIGSDFCLRIREIFLDRRINVVCITFENYRSETILSYFVAYLQLLIWQSICQGPLNCFPLLKSISN